MANVYKHQDFRRKRLPRYKFEASDRTLLQNLVNKYIGILERKAINQNMLDEKKRAWQIITQKFNTQSVDKRVRDAKQLRKCWENMKWRARREVKQADFDTGEGEKLRDVTHPSHLTSSMMGVQTIRDGSFDDDDDIYMYEDEGEDDEEEEELVAPLGTEPIEITEDPDLNTNGNAPLNLMMPHPDPGQVGRHPMSHPPDDELIGSFVADAWMAEEGPAQDDDREAIHIKAEVIDVVEPVDDNSLWNGSTSPARSLGGTSSTHKSRTPPLATSDVSQDPTPRAPSVVSSIGDAAESLSSRHSVSSISRGNKRQRDKVTHNHIQPRPSSIASSLVHVDGDAAASSLRVRVDEDERQQRADEEHAKRMELIRAQLDYEKSKVERMQRMMEMSEIEHRARMRMLVRYQQVAEKQKEYWTHHVDNARKDQPPPDQF